MISVSTFAGALCLLSSETFEMWLDGWLDGKSRR